MHNLKVLLLLLLIRQSVVYDSVALMREEIDEVVSTLHELRCALPHPQEDLR